MDQISPYKHCCFLLVFGCIYKYIILESSADIVIYINKNDRYQQLNSESFYRNTMKRTTKEKCDFCLRLI